MNIYLKTKKARVFAIAIFLTFLSVIFFTFTLNTFATSTELESVLRNASGTTSNEAVAGSTYLFINKLNGPSLVGGSAEADKDDVIRSFTFYDKTKVSFFGLFRHDASGQPPSTQSALQYIGHWTFDNFTDDIYASQVFTYPLTAAAADSRYAESYGTSGDGVYNGNPLNYIYNLNITTDPGAGERNPCKKVYDDAVGTTDTTIFTTLKTTTAANIGCVGFERFKGYNSGTSSTGVDYFISPNSDLYGLHFKVKSGTANGDTDLISVATSDGYNNSPIKETVKTITVVDPAFEIKTLDVINPTQGGETEEFEVKIEFLADVSGFAEDADFRFVEKGTTTEVGDITRVREVEPFYLFSGEDTGPVDTLHGVDQYDYFKKNFFVVTVEPGQGLSSTSLDSYQFEINPNTAVDTVNGSVGYDTSIENTYKLSVQVFSTFLFSDLEIPESTVTNTFSQRDYDPGGGSFQKRDYFSRSGVIDVEFIANSNNGGGHPLPADFALKEVGTSTTDCSNNTPTFSNITLDTSITNLYSMTITLPTGKYNCLLSYSQTIGGTKTEKTVPIKFTGKEYFTETVLKDVVFNTFYVNTEPRVVSFNPSPATNVKSNSRTHNITSSSAFNYFTTDIGANVDVYDELIDQATDCDAALSWDTKTKTDDDFTTDDENQNGKYICVRTYDDFITTSDGESLYSYDKLVVENVDTTDPTITDLSPKNSGTQDHNFEVKVSFNEDVKNINIADFTFVENDNTTGTVSTSSAGAITKVESFDSTFLTSTGDSTTDSTPIEGQYFLVSVTANDDISTTTDITYEFQIDTNISDIAGNTVGSSAANTTLEVDIDTQTNPTVSVDITNTGVSGVLGKEFVVDVSFSEEVVNVDAADFVFLETSGGTSAGSITSISAFEDSDFTTADTTPDTSRYYQVSVTAIDDLVSIANGYSFRILNVTGSAIADKVGNLLDIGSSTDDVRLNFIISNIDTTKPTATIAAITDTKNAAFTVQVSFSETVNSVGLADFELTDGSTDVASVTKVEAFNSTFLNSTGSSTTTSALISGQYFVVTVTPDSSLEGSYTFKILATTTDTIADDLSNPFVEEAINSQIQVAIDTTDPTATVEEITDTQNGAFTVKVSFSESVSNVDIRDFRFVLSNTSTNLSSITKVEAFDESFNTSTGSSTTNSSTISGQYFAVSLTPSNDIETNSSTTYSFEVFPNSANTITDTIGNTLSAIVSANISVDTKKPTATVAVDGSGIQVRNFAVNVTFSEDVENVSIDDFTFIQTGSSTSTGTITGVEKHSDSNFNDQSPSTTTQTGQYFKVLVEAINDIETDSTTTFTFNVIANTDQTSLIKDTSENTFQTDSNSSTLVNINTKSVPTVSSVSAPSDAQIDVFDVNVTFSETVSNVDIGDFRLVLKGTDTASATTFGTIVVEAHSDSTFSDSSPSTTSTSTPLSGRYFKVKVTPQDDLLTDTGVTEYEFQVINDTTNSIIDGASNTLGAQSFSGVIRGTADINIDTVHPKTESISFDTTVTQTTTFDVDVTFSEGLSNVTTGNFNFTDGTDQKGVIESITIYNSDFTSEGASTTDSSVSLGGRYFRVSIKPSDDISGTYTFSVLSASMTDNNGNTFQTSTEDTLDITVDTERAATLSSVSVVHPLTTPKTGDFEIDVIFSEVVNGVDTGDFRFVRKDTDNLKGSITKVEAHSDSNFNDPSPTITTTATTISGQYFRVTVSPKAALRTNSSGTPPVEYTFEILSSGSITDEANNAFDSTTGAATTLDVAVDTLDPLITSTEIVDDKLVLTSSLSLVDATVTGTGGFTVTGSDSTVYTVSSVAVSGTTITITLTLPTGTTPTNRGTYSYTKNTTLNIKTSSNNALANISSTAYGPDFTLDLDGSGGYTASQDGLFLYLYTQTAKPLADSALELFIDSSSSLEDTKGIIDEATTASSLDLDGSGGYTASQDGLFLYLYTQTAKPLADSALELFIDSSSSLEDTKDNVAKFLP